jgi:hypothetical protein
MSESTLQADLQRELLRLTSTFSSGDVTIGDWSVLDGSSQAAPFAIIEMADGFSMIDIQGERSNTWPIPFTILVAFSDWDTSMTAIRDLRETILNALVKVENYTATSAGLGWGLRTIAAGTGISEVYDRYQENAAESLPVYLSQQIVLEVEEVSGG